MRLALLALTAGTVLALAPSVLAAGAAGGMVTTTLTGICTLENHDNKIGTTLWSIVTCDAAGSCRCTGATKLVFHTESKYPATAPGGSEKGTLTATSRGATVILALAGRRESSLTGIGTWKLAKASGSTGSALRKQGTYALATKELSNIVGTTSTKVRITATLACWACA